jgi:dienelactone hydrolase
VAVEDLPVGGGATLDVYVPPLDEKSRYLVVVTNGVQDVAGQPLKRSTLMDIVFSFSSPLYDDNGTPADASDDVNHAASLGLSAADARGLQGLRTQLKPVLTGLGLADCTGTSPCAALAYTVTTQSVKDVTIGLSGLPYLLEVAAGAPVFVPGTPVDFDTNASVGIPSVAFPTVARFLRVDVPTVNALVGRVVDGAPDPLNGALDPRLADLQRPADDPAFGAAVQYFLAPERRQQLPALIAVPTRAAVTAAGFGACPWLPSGPPCVPLVVFQHGINGAAYQSLAFVDALAAKGFVVVAIDAPYHGDRSLCTSDAECVALDGTSAGVCTPLPERQTATDATPPGTCIGANSANRISSLAAEASGNFFVSSNFFRTRDASRQIVIDHSALTLALARPPVPGAAADPLQQALATGDDALVVDPRAVYLAGYSLGGQWGAPIAATNPRYRAATFTASGGTLVDVFTSIQVPEYQETLAEVFAGLGIDLTKVQPGPNFDPAVAARYVQTLALAKWILDPVEPLNYAAPLRTGKAYAPGLQPLVDAGMGSATTDTYGQLFTGVEVNGVPTSDALFQSRYSRLFYELAGIDYTTYQSASITDGRVLHGLLLANFVNPPDVPMQGGLVIRDDLASFLLDRAFPGDAVAIP